MPNFVKELAGDLLLIVIVKVPKLLRVLVQVIYKAIGIKVITMIEGLIV